MREELDKALCAKYPLLFSDRNGDMRDTAMCWGFPGDGWYQLLDELGAELEPLIQQQIKEGIDPDYGHTRATQVKEKFGTLRFYTNYSTNEMNWLIDIAENRSSYTCEQCGSEEGKIRDGGWIVTSCDRCHLDTVARQIVAIEEEDKEKRKEAISKVLKFRFFPKMFYADWEKEHPEHPRFKRHVETRKEKIISFLKWKVWWNLKAPFSKYFWKYGPDKWKTRIQYIIWKLKRRWQGKRLG